MRLNSVRASKAQLWHDAEVLFAGVALARRIENAECRLLIDGAETARRQPGGDDVLVAPIAGGVAVFAGAGSPVNKLAGLGFAGAVDEIALEAVAREFERRGATLQVELSSLAETSIGTMLTRRGYVLVGFENVLGLRLDQASLSRLGPSTAPPDAAITITEATLEETPAWGDAIITGFEHPDTVEGLTPHESFQRDILERCLAMFAYAPGFRRYLARRGGVVAGGASLRLCDGVAQLCGAATLPAHRRRGVQSALLRARLNDAAGEGCDIAVMTTQPGSKSQENGLRQGFTLLYTRAILRREPH